MGDVFNAEEVLEMAGQLERNGAKFYRRAAELVQDRGAKELFASLASMEEEHEGVFAKLVDQQAKTLLLGDADGEVVLYLRALASGHLFKDGEAQRLPPNVSVAEVLRRAIALEKDSVSYYQAVRVLVPEELGRTKIDAIIREEMKHVTLLTDRLRALGAPP